MRLSCVSKRLQCSIEITYVDRRGTGTASLRIYGPQVVQVQNGKVVAHWVSPGAASLWERDQARQELNETILIC